MKIGMIFECGRQGPDEKVCEYLAHEIRPDLEIVSIPLSNKLNLINECGKVAMKLLDTGCERIFIIWDLYPAWSEKSPCQREDCLKIQESLKKEKIDLEKIDLICITAMLETWLIADGQAISAVLSTPEHPKKITDKRFPDRETRPKKYLKGIFEQNIGRPYNDFQDAEKIVKAMTNFRKIRNSSSFVRFENKLKEI